jgi:hypothetical protein
VPNVNNSIRINITVYNQNLDFKIEYIIILDHIQDSFSSKLKSKYIIRQIDTQKDSKMGTKNIHDTLTIHILYTIPHLVSEIAMSEDT